MVYTIDRDQSLSLENLLIADSNIAPLRCNLYAAESEKLIEAFMVKYDLLFPQFPLVNTMNAYMYPDATLERLTVCGKIMALLFHIDDVYADTAESRGMMGGKVPAEYLAKIERAATAFETGWLPPNSGGLEAAFREIRLEIQEHVEPEWMVRFAEAVRLHITYAINPQAYGWSPDGCVPYERYAWLREVISGMYLAIDLIEYVNHFALLSQIVYHPTIGRLRQACSRIAAFANDLFSYEKEVINEGLRFNLVAVLESSRRLNFADAVHKTIEITNHETRDFYRLAYEVEIWDGDTNDLVRRYVDGMIYQVSATWHWQMRTARYRSANSPFKQLIKPLNG